MAKSKQSYSKGLNRDASRSKIDPSSYYDALNVRVLTDSGLSTGSLINEQGTISSFNIPTIPQMTIGVSIIPAQSELKIIGWTTLRNDIIIFTTSNDSETPTSIGQIWKVSYDEVTERIIGILPNNFLNADTITNGGHLVYNNQLNISSRYRIKAVSRYENTTTGRVYWTDFYNRLRTINVYNPLSIGISPNLLDITADVKFSKPKPKSVGTGSLPAGSNVQITYKLINVDGAETLYAPVSSIVQLGGGDPNTLDFQQYQGSAYQAFPTNKSVTFTIDNIDSNYNLLQVVAILYEDLDVPQIFRFAEYTVNGGSVTVTLAGNEARVPITLQELNMLNPGFDTCKDLEIKDDLLIAANIKTTKVKLNFDARAYRFGSSKTALLEDASLGNITLSNAVYGVPPAYSTVPTEHDCINPYNDEDKITNPNWVTSDQYKYQADGVTLGGSGPNITYKFVTKTLLGDNVGSYNTPSNKPYVMSNTTGAATRYATGSTTDFKELDVDGNLITFDLSNQYKNLKSPITSANIKSFARGEVYRIGIEGITTKGSQTFVEWIGDIKFPDPIDQNGAPTGFHIANGSTESANLELYPLGLEVSVDITSIRDQISAFRIVMVERTTEERSRWGTGTLMIIDRQGNDHTGAIGKTLYEAYSLQTESLDPRESRCKDIVVNGSSRDLYHLPDMPGLHLQTNEGFYPGGSNGYYPALYQNVILISPIGNFASQTGLTLNTNDILKTIGYYKASTSLYGVNDSDKAAAFVHKLSQFEGFDDKHTLGLEYFNIEAQRVLKPGEAIIAGDALYSGSVNGKYGIINASYTTENIFNASLEVPQGMGNYNHFLSLRNDLTSAYTAAQNMQWNDFDNLITNVWNPIAGQRITNILKFKEVAYIKVLIKQYGGNTYEDRSKSIYTTTGHYQVVSPAILNSITNQVFGGDSYVSYYDNEYISQYLGHTTMAAYGTDIYGDPIDTGGESRALSVSICVPVEMPINMDLRGGTHWAKDRDSNNTGAYAFEDFVLNKIYRQINNTEAKSVPMDFAAKTTEEFSHRLWASDPKTDGELVDSWRSFLPNNFKEVTGKFGPINGILNHQNRLYFWQDSAFGVASINEREINSSASGVPLVLGTGGILDFIQYVSNTVGTIYQFGIVQGQNSVYFYDSKSQKFFSLSIGTSGPNVQALSDVEGLNSFFANEVKGHILDTDLTVRTLGGFPTGIHGGYDFRYNRVLFTFLNAEESNFTISYNELTNAFESFYSFTPHLYLKQGRRLLSADPSTDSKVYIHNRGDYGKFYENDIAESYITLIVAPDADMTKIFNNIEYNSELTLESVDIPLETLSSIEIFNEYQRSGSIPLIVGDNIKRRMRKWRYTIGRDINSTNSTARFRNPSIFIKLGFDNNGNKRLVLHDIIISYNSVRN
jgi:hypothetical protein